MDADVEISKPGESSFGAAAKDVKITTTIDTLVKGMYNFHYEGEDACIGMFPQDGRGAINILKMLLETVKQSKTGLLALDNHDKEMVGKELLKVKKLELRKIIKSWTCHHWQGSFISRSSTSKDNQIVDVSPLAGLVHLTAALAGWYNQIVDVSPLAGLVNLTKLNLNGNQIVDVSPLAGLVNLTHAQPR